ncbi:MAG: HAD family hydrolase, partial [Actinobacteria bacterium]|nr:HAD family hydrolase [Actinomycetota bacterium]
MPEIRAAFFDFGGVILSSPFEAFAEYERRTGLPDGFIRGLNATNP